MKLTEVAKLGKYKCKKCGRQLNEKNKGFFEEALERLEGGGRGLHESGERRLPLSEIICDVCHRKKDRESHEDWAKGWGYYKKCHECGTEFLPRYVSSSPGGEKTPSGYDADGVTRINTNRNNDDGEMYCHRCMAAINNAKAIKNAKNFRDRLVANKKHLEDLKKKKPSPKSRFQLMSEDQMRVIQLIKDRNNKW